MDIRSLMAAFIKRIVMGAIAAGVGALIGLIGFDAYHFREASSTATVWVAVIGFALGAGFGNRSLAGRPAWIMSGVVTGIALGALVGHIWGRIELGVVLRQIEGAGRSPPETKGGGFRTHLYDDIGVRYGIGIGAIIGLAAGITLKRRLKTTLGFSAISAWVLVAIIKMMNAEFHAISIEEMRYSEPKLEEAAHDASKRTLSEPDK